MFRPRHSDYLPIVQKGRASTTGEDRNLVRAKPEAQNGSMNLRVCVVEDDALTRLALTTALRSKGITISFEAGAASEAIRLSMQVISDVAVLDLHLGEGPTGLDVAQALRRKSPGIGIVFLTSFDDPRLLNPSLPSLPGGAQYLTKNSIKDVSTLYEAVLLAASGKGKTATIGKSGETSVLSSTQIETLKLVSEGLTNAEIAKKRFVTEKSVEVSITRIAKALGLSPDVTKNQRVHMAKAFFRASGNKSA